ncbi:MAG: hypothetical protein ACR2NX_11255 [Chthoniobacterales bacterium]
MPAGIKLLAAFFCFGAAMCLLTLVLLTFPGGRLDFIWRIKPDARADFQLLGGWAFPLMATVGLACAWAAIGLAHQKRWGRNLALAILCANLLGDTLSAVWRHDYRMLIGWPIGGAMIFYLIKAGSRFPRER